MLHHPISLIKTPVLWASPQWNHLSLLHSSQLSWPFFLGRTVERSVCFLWLNTCHPGLFPLNLLSRRSRLRQYLIVVEATYMFNR